MYHSIAVGNNSQQLEYLVRITVSTKSTMRSFASFIQVAESKAAKLFLPSCLRPLADNICLRLNVGAHEALLYEIKAIILYRGLLRIVVEPVLAILAVVRDGETDLIEPDYLGWVLNITTKATIISFLESHATGYKLNICGKAHPGTVHAKVTL